MTMREYAIKNWIELLDGNSLIFLLVVFMVIGLILWAYQLIGRSMGRTYWMKPRALQLFSILVVLFVVGYTAFLYDWYVLSHFLFCN